MIIDSNVSAQNNLLIIGATKRSSVIYILIKMEITIIEDKIGSKSEDGKYEIVMWEYVMGGLIRNLETGKRYLCMVTDKFHKPDEKHELDKPAEFTANIYGRPYLCYEFKDTYQRIVEVKYKDGCVSVVKQILEIYEQNDLITINEDHVYYDASIQKVILFNAISPAEAPTYQQIIRDFTSIYSLSKYIPSDDDKAWIRNKIDIKQIKLKCQARPLSLITQAHKFFESFSCKLDEDTSNFLKGVFPRYGFNKNCINELIGALKTIAIDPLRNPVPILKPIPEPIRKVDDIKIGDIILGDKKVIAKITVGVSGIKFVVETPSGRTFLKFFDDRNMLVTEFENSKRIYETCPEITVRPIAKYETKDSGLDWFGLEFEYLVGVILGDRLESLTISMLKDFASKFRKIMNKWKNFQHYDTNNGNIMVDEKNNLRLIDFGLSNFQGTQNIGDCANSLGVDIGTLIDKTGIDVWSFPQIDLDKTATININGMSYKIYLNDELRTFIHQHVTGIMRYSGYDLDVHRDFINEHRDFINEYILNGYNQSELVHILRANPDAVIAGLLKVFTNT